MAHIKYISRIQFSSNVKLLKQNPSIGNEQYRKSNFRSNPAILFNKLSLKIVSIDFWLVKSKIDKKGKFKGMYMGLDKKKLFNCSATVPE